MSRSITDINNSKNDNPTVYPRGYVVDAAGAEPGSTVGEAMVGDILQFFSKLQADTLPLVTPNGQPDNEANGYQLFQAFVNYIRNVLTATETAKGTVEKATVTEVEDGIADKYLDAANIQNLTATETRKGIAEMATDSEGQIGSDETTIINPSVLGYVSRPRSIILSTGQTYPVANGIGVVSIPDGAANITIQLPDAGVFAGHKIIIVANGATSTSVVTGQGISGPAVAIQSNRMYLLVSIGAKWFKIDLGVVENPGN
jgi:hypothetical protein